VSGSPAPERDARMRRTPVACDQPGLNSLVTWEAYHPTRLPQRLFAAAVGLADRTLSAIGAAMCCCPATIGDLRRLASRLPGRAGLLAWLGLGTGADDARKLAQEYRKGERHV